MNRAVAPAVAVFLLLWLVAACLDISSPIAGIGAISPVIAPTPSVVIGDSSRDTLGNVQALRVDVFAPNGDRVLDARIVFFAIDTTGGLRVDSSTGIAHGNALSPNARVVARVTSADGGASLQTPLLLFPVVPTPASVTRDSNITLFEFNPPASEVDTFATGLISAPISVTVRGAADTLIPQYFVSFELVKWPASRSADSTVVLATDNGRASTIDTTDGSGHASRRLRVRYPALQADVAAGTKQDTAIVRAHVKKPSGEKLPGSPVEFIVPLRLLTP